MKALSAVFFLLVIPSAQAQIVCDSPVSYPSSNGQYTYGQKFQLQIQCRSDNPRARLRYKWSTPTPTPDSPSIRFALKKSAQVAVEVTEAVDCTGIPNCQAGSFKSEPLPLKIATRCQYQPSTGSVAAGLVCPGRLKITADQKPVNTSGCPTDPKPPAESCAKPVNTASGAMWHEQVDIFVKGRTPTTGLQFRRMYTAHSATGSGPLGPNWQHNYESKLIKYVDPNTLLTDIIWIDESGGPYIFRGQSNGTFVGPPGLNITLTADLANGPPMGPIYVLRKANRTSYTFSASSGALLKYAEPHGDELTFNYDSGGRLSTVTNPYAGTMQFFYGGSRNRLIGVRTPFSSAIMAYTYHADGRLASVTDISNRTHSFTYITNQPNTVNQGLLEKIVDPIGRELRFTYDSMGRALQQFEPGGGIWSFDYGTLQTRVTAPNTFSTEYFFDSKLREIKRRLPDGTVFNTTWNAAGYRASEGYDLGGTTLYGYDGNGNLASIQRPLDPAPTTIVYDQDFNVPTVITPLIGAPTQFAIDPNNGDVLNVSRVGSLETLALTYTRDAFGNMLSTDNGLATYADQRDTHGRLTKKFDLHNSVTLTYLTAFHMPHKLTFAKGRVIDTQFNVDYLPVRFTDSHAPTTEFFYDNAKRLIRRTRTFSAPPLPAETQHALYEYDHRDRIIEIFKSGLGETKFTYDPVQVRSQPSSIIDPAGRVITFEYDSRDRLIKKTDPLLGSTVYTYDQRNNLTSVKDANGSLTIFTYDLNNRLLSEIRPTVYGSGVSNFATNVVINYFYDLGDRLVRKEYVSPTGGDTRAVVFAYDDFDRVVSKVIQRQGGSTVVEDSSSYTYSPQIDAELLTSANNQVANESFTYENAPPFANRSFSLNAAQAGNPLGLLEGIYDVQVGLSGKIESISKGGGTPFFEKEYDAASRLSVAKIGSLFTYNQGYDGFGRKQSMNAGSAGFGNYSYDTANRVLGVSWWSSSTQQAGRSLAYNPAGRITNLNEMSLSGNILTALAHDADGQLVSSVSSGVLTQSRSWIYDLLGNRLQDSESGAGSFINNFLVSNGNSSFLADSAGFGDTVRETSGAVVKNFGYRADGLLNSFQMGATQATYHYDALGRRVAKLIDTGSGPFTQSFVHIGTEDRILLGKAGNGTVTTYLDGEGVDEHIAESTGTSVKLYYTDHLGSVINGEAGGAARRFGNFGESSATISVSETSNPVMYGFTGREYDAESGLYYHRARYFNPKIGRWLNQDPIGLDGGDVNLYRYAGNSPLSNVDPDGKLYFGAHFSITYDAARQAGMSIFDSAKLAAKVVWQDWGTQSSNPSDTVLHAMVGNNQSVQEAKDNVNAFINNPTNDMAARLHAVQDRAAPWHYGEKWTEDTTWGEWLEHLVHDTFPGDDVRAKALKDSKDVLLGKRSCP